MTLLLLFGGGLLPSVAMIEAVGVGYCFEVSASPAADTAQDWHDLTAYVDRTGPIVVDRGRQFADDAMRAGTLNLTLDASNGDLDPRNTGSIHADCLKPRRRCRLRLLHDGIVYPAFYGHTNGYPRGLTRPMTRMAIPFTATDGLRILTNPPSARHGFILGDPIYGRLGYGRLGGSTLGRQLSGARITSLLNAIGWPADLRNIATGRVEVEGSDVDRGIQAMQEAADAEGGDLFIDRNGVVVFRDRLARYLDTRSTTPQATFSPKNTESPFYDQPLQVANDDTRMVNTAIYTGTSGTEQLRTDQPSVDEWGTFADKRSFIAVDDDDVRGLAVLRVNDNSQPGDRFEDLVINAHALGNTAAIPAVLGRELLDLIAFDVPSTYSDDLETIEAVIQGTRLELSPQSMQMRFRLGPYKARQFLTLGHPTLGRLGSGGVLAP